MRLKERIQEAERERDDNTIKEFVCRCGNIYDTQFGLYLHQNRSEDSRCKIVGREQVEKRKGKRKKKRAIRKREVVKVRKVEKEEIFEDKE